MVAVSEITEAIYRARFEDSMTAGADSARRSVEKLGVQVQDTDERVTRSSRSGRAWVNSADEVTAAALKSEKAKRELARATEAVNESLARGEVTSEQAARALTKLQADAERAEQRLMAVTAAQSAAGDSATTMGQRIDAAAAAAQRAASYQAALNQQLGVTNRSGEDYARRAADVGAYGAELDRLRAKFNPLYAEQQRYKSTLQEIAEAERLGAINAREAAAARQETKAAFADQIRSMQGIREESGQVTNSLGLQRYQMQNLTAQAVDFAVQIGSGGGLLMPLIQQGPQAVDAVGGLSRAFSIIGSVLTPTRLAIGGVTAAIAASVVIAEAQDRALANLSNRLQATRNDYDGLARSTNEAARAAAANSSLSTSEARQAGGIIAGSRDFAGTTSQLQSLIQLSGRLATVLGIDTADAAGKLATALSKPTQAARDMADAGLRGMNEGLLRTIERFENQGRVAEASRLVLEAYRGTAEQVAKSPLQAAFDNLSQAVSRLFLQIQPLTDWLGDKLASALAFVVEKVAALIDRIAAMAKQVREVLGFQVPESTATTQRSATEIALERARQIGGRDRDRQNVADQITGLRAGLPGATAEEARLIGGAIRELQERYEGLRGPVADYLQGLAEQARLAGVAEGAAREYAQAQQALEKVHASAAEQAEARALVERRLRGEQAVFLDGLNREINAAQDLARAQAEGNGAALEVEARLRAQAAALRFNIEGTSDYEKVVATLTTRYQGLAEAQRDAAAANAERDQRNQIELLRAEAAAIGQGEQVRTRELAVLRERQRILSEAKGDEASLLTETAQKRLANAAAIADETAALQRQRSVMQELASLGEQVFDRIGQAITQAFVEGRGAAINFGNVAKGVLSQVLAYVLRIAVVRPLGNALLGSNQGTFADLFGGSTPAAAATAVAAVAQSSGVPEPAASAPSGSTSIDYSTLNLVHIPAGSSAVQAQRIAAAAVRSLDVEDPDYYAKLTTINNAMIAARGYQPRPAVTEASLAAPSASSSLSSPVNALGSLVLSNVTGGGSGGLLSSLGSSLGLTGAGGLLGSTLWTTSSGAAASAALPAGMMGPTVPASALGSMGMGTTVGSLLSGAGIGFAGGMLTSSIVGGMRGTVGPGGTIGAAGGALAGAAIGSIIPGIGTVIGGLIGGAVGGGGGAMFGPTKKGLASRSGGDVGYGIDPSGRLYVTGSGGNRWDAAESIGAVQQQLDGINQGAAQRGLTLTWRGQTAGIVGFGAASSNAREINPANIGAIAQGGSAAVRQALAAVDGRGPQAAFDAVDWVRQTFEQLGKSDRVASYWKALDELNQTFGKAIDKARELGLSEEDLVAQRDERIRRLNEDRSNQLGAIDANLNARMLRARGDEQGAALAAFDQTAAEETRSLWQKLFELGLEGTQEHYDRVTRLERTLAAERLQIVQQFADQAAAAEAAAAQAREQAAAQAAAQAKAEMEARQAAITQERLGLEQTILQLEGNTAELRRRETENLDASNRALQQRIYALQDESQAVAAAAARLDQARSSATGIVANLADYARGLRVANDNAGNPLSRFDAASKQFGADLSGATSGDFAALARLQQSAEIYRGAARDVYGSGFGFADAEARITSALDQVAGLGSDALTASSMANIQQASAETIVAAIERLKSEVAALRREQQSAAANPLVSRVA